MPVLVARALSGHAAIKRGLQVSARLVGQAQRHKQHVGQLFAEVLVLVGLLFGLLAVAPGNDSGYLAHLFAELGHVGELVEVAHAKIGNPLIYFGLQGPHGLLVVKRHHSLFLESMVIVTGPSLTSATFMSAPNTPDFTGKLASFQSTSRKSS